MPAQWMKRIGRPLGSRLQHGQQRGDADAGTDDQHQRLARGTQGEIAGRGEQLQLIALAHLLMQMVGNPPTEPRA